MKPFCCRYFAHSLQLFPQQFFLDNFHFRSHLPQVFSVAFSFCSPFCETIFLQIFCAFTAADCSAIFLIIIHFHFRSHLPQDFSVAFSFGSPFCEAIFLQIFCPVTAAVCSAIFFDHYSLSLPQPKAAGFFCSMFFPQPLL